jgi:hypothetical protein
MTVPSQSILAPTKCLSRNLETYTFNSTVLMEEIYCNCINQQLNLHYSHGVYDMSILLFNGLPEYIAEFVKVKHSHYRPGQVHRVPGGWGSQISRQSAYEGGKVVSPTHRPPLPSRKYSWYSFLLEVESTPGPYWSRKDCQWKIPVTPLGIKPATFRFVAQCLN